jgi:hypothetical protein
MILIPVMTISSKLGLGGMGYSCIHTKRQFQIANLLKIDFKFQILILQVVMFQNVLMDLKISKEKQIPLLFSTSFGIFVFYLFIY